MALVFIACCFLTLLPSNIFKLLSAHEPSNLYKLFLLHTSSQLPSLLKPPVETPTVVERGQQNQRAEAPLMRRTTHEDHPTFAPPT